MAVDGSGLAVAAIERRCGQATPVSGGESQEQVIQDILQGSPGMSVDTATDFAETSIDIYCPDGHPDDPT
jgi:hypothetical protein